MKSIVATSKTTSAELRLPSKVNRGKLVEILKDYGGSKYGYDMACQTNLDLA